MPEHRSEVQCLNHLLEKYLRNGRLGEKSMSHLLDLGEHKWKTLNNKNKIQIILKRKSSEMGKPRELPQSERENCSCMTKAYMDDMDDEDMIVSDSDSCCPPKKKRKRSPSCAPKKRKKSSCAAKKRKPRCPMKKKPRCPSKKKPIKKKRC